jgi:hypothetical protein
VLECLVVVVVLLGVFIDVFGVVLIVFCRCGYCDTAFYCTRVCQQSHWLVHEAKCVAIRKQSEEGQQEKDSNSKEMENEEKKEENKEENKKEEEKKKPQRSKAQTALDRRKKLRCLLRTKEDVLHDNIDRLVVTTQCLPRLARQALKR